MGGLADAEVDSLLLRAGNFLVELVEYRSPQPAPLPEGYRIRDQGFMDVALGYRGRQEYDRAFAAATTERIGVTRRRRGRECTWLPARADRSGYADH